jgi:hypothetical protein
MEQQFAFISDWLVRWPDLISGLVSAVGLPIDGPRAIWTVVQIILVIAAYMLAALASRFTVPPLEAFVRGARLRPGILRLAATALRRVRGI